MIDTWPPNGGSPIFIRGYRGKAYEDTIESYYRDSVLLHLQGYEPAGQHYVEGRWSVAMAVIATVLIPFLVGVIMWLFMLVTRPTGTLTVTYLRPMATQESPAASPSDAR